AISVPFLMMLGTLCGAWMTLSSAHAALGQKGLGTWGQCFLDAKLAYARVYTTQSLPKIQQYTQTIQAGGQAIDAISPEMLWA
ncbi:MAG: acyl-CoA dehydrogenase C-terminal domain-containing protein, partial [Rhodobacterales bacterium]